MGYVAEDGQVFVTDRIKDIIPRSGYKVFISISNRELSKSKTLYSRLYLCDIPSAEEGASPVVYAVLEEKYRNQNLEESMKEDITNAFLESYLPDYNYPYEIIFREVFTTDFCWKN